MFASLSTSSVSKFLLVVSVSAFASFATQAKTVIYAGQIKNIPVTMTFNLIPESPVHIDVSLEDNQWIIAMDAQPGTISLSYGNFIQTTPLDVTGSGSISGDQQPPWNVMASDYSFMSVTTPKIELAQGNLLELGSLFGANNVIPLAISEDNRVMDIRWPAQLLTTWTMGNGKVPSESGSVHFIRQ